MKENYYNDFKEQMKQSKPISRQDFIQQPVHQAVPQNPSPIVTPVINQEVPQETPVETPEVKGNGHKEVEALESTIPDDEKTNEHAQEIADTRRDMMEAEKTKNIPGNGYMFNREKKHLVEDMYLDTVLEGSIAVEGKARVDFVALTQFKNDERAQAAHGSLFGTGPNG